MRQNILILVLGVLLILAGWKINHEAQYHPKYIEFPEEGYGITKYDSLYIRDKGDTSIIEFYRNLPDQQDKSNIRIANNSILVDTSIHEHMDTLINKLDSSKKH